MTDHKMLFRHDRSRYLEAVCRANWLLRQMLSLYKLRKPKQVFILRNHEAAVEMHKIYLEWQRIFLGSNVKRVKYFLHNPRYPEQLRRFMSESDDLHILCISAREFAKYHRSVSDPLKDDSGTALLCKSFDLLRNSDLVSYHYFEKDGGIGRQSFKGLFLLTDYVWSVTKEWEYRPFKICPLSDPKLFEKEPPFELRPFSDPPYGLAPF